MKFVTTMGAVWKISERNYKALVREIAETGAVADLDKYGKMVATDLARLADIISRVEGESALNDFNYVGSKHHY